LHNYQFWRTHHIALAVEVLAVAAPWRSLHQQAAAEARTQQHTICSVLLQVAAVTASKLLLLLLLTCVIDEHCCASYE
jgi:hypothetical protein